MIDYLNYLIYLFRSLSQLQQFFVLLAMFIPFVVISVTQYYLKNWYKHYKGKHDFYKFTKQKNLSKRDTNFISNLIQMFNGPLKPEYISHPYFFWRLINQFQKFCKTKNMETKKALRVIDKIKSIGKQIFGKIPERYHTTKDFPLKLEMVIEFPGIKRKIKGWVYHNSLIDWGFYSNQLSRMYNKIYQTQKIEASIVQQPKGIYFVNTEVRSVKKIDKGLITLNHSIDVLFRNLRRFERFEMNAKTEISPEIPFENRPEKVYWGKILDISRGGMKLISEHFLEEKTEIFLRFNFLNRIYHFNAKVTGETKDAYSKEVYTHIKFNKMNHKDTKKLYSLVDKLKRMNQDKN